MALEVEISSPTVVIMIGTKISKLFQDLKILVSQVLMKEAASIQSDNVKKF